MTTTKSYSLTLLQDHELLCSLDSVMIRDHETTADMLAHLCEAITRRLWADQGYPSMLEFCVRGLKMSEGVALKRIQAAKAANDYPAIYGLLAQGRLHLSAVCMLAPKLEPENAADLLEAATHQSKAGVARVLAQWFPKPDVATSIRRFECEAFSPDHAPKGDLLLLASAAMSPAKLAPLSVETYELRCTLSNLMHEKLRHLQALLRSAVRSGDIPTVLELALDALIDAKEKQKFAVTSRPNKQKGSAKGRHIPAHVRREVLEREGGCCTFRSGNGTVCGTQRNLHFDHITPFACGGESTTANLRLRCSAHNRLEAERRFGKGFMDRKVLEVRSSVPKPYPSPRLKPSPLDHAPTTHDPDHTVILEQREEIIPYLRKLGYRNAQATWAAAMCDPIAGERLEARVKFAIQQLGRARFERNTVRPGSA